MSNIGFAALSGMQVAQLVENMVAHNVSNAETPGFHVYSEHNVEQGPLPYVGGVSTSITRAENSMMDDLMRTAAADKAAADITNEAYDTLAKIPMDDLQTSYSKMMEASQNLLRTPNDPIAQEAFNQTTLGFQNSTERYQGRLDQMKSNTELKADIQSSRITMLEQKLQEVAKNGTTDPNEVYDLKMQLMQASKSLDAYQKVLSGIIPPVELAFRNATSSVHTNINKLSDKEVFKDGKSQYLTDFTGFDRTKIPEWDSHGYNTELGRIQTAIGFRSQDAQLDSDAATRRLDQVAADYNAQFGVDLVEQQVKAMQYKRMYESRAEMIKVQDSLIGTAINMAAR